MAYDCEHAARLQRTERHTVDYSIRFIGRDIQAVEVRIDGCVIDIETLSVAERKALAADLQNAIDDLLSGLDDQS